MSRIFIFGLDHFHQNLETGCCTVAGIADEQEQKLALSDTLREIIIERRILLIAEEAKFDRPCLGFQLAQEYKLGHINITMPLNEREGRGIHTPQYDLRETTRRIAYRIFEQYMFDQVKAIGVDPVLVMCGCRHLVGLDCRFRSAGDGVLSYDIHSFPWYRGIPKEGEDGVIGYEREPS